MSFDDTILLSIKRTYSKEECMKLLIDELSIAKFKIGELLSENEELKDKIKETSKLRAHKFGGSKLSAPLIWLKPKLTKEDFKEERFVELNKKLSTQGDTIKRLKDDLNLWRSKVLNLTARFEKENAIVMATKK